MRRGNPYFVLSGLLVLAACSGADTALERGDRFWADGNFASALAEYRLAARQDATDPSVLARVAHAYAATGQLDHSREEYTRLVKLAPELADQAVFDYLTLARAAAARSDRFGLARAVEAALDLKPGIDVSAWAPPLARYYASSGDADRALEYFERALAVESEANAPRLLFEIAVLHERQGACGEASTYYRSYLLREPYGDSANDARFRIGSCAFEQGRRARADGRLEQALEYFATVTDYESPANLQDQAWFERGETLLSLGRATEALQAFRRVVELTAGQDTQTSVRARRRLMELQSTTVSQLGIAGPPGPHRIETALPRQVYGAALMDTATG